MVNGGDFSGGIPVKLDNICYEQSQCLHQNYKKNMRNRVEPCLKEFDKPNTH